MKWIKASDGLPVAGRPVLVIFREKIYPRVFVLVSYGGGTEAHRWEPFGDDDAFISLLSVSHWAYLDDIPLPQPPEE